MEKRKIWYKFIGVVLSVSMLISAPLSVYADNKDEVVNNEIDSLVLASSDSSNSDDLDTDEKILDSAVFGSSVTPVIMMSEDDGIAVTAEVEDTESTNSQILWGKWDGTKYIETGATTGVYFYIVNSDGTEVRVDSAKVRINSEFKSFEKQVLPENETINFIDETSNTKNVDFRYAEINGEYYNLKKATRAYRDEYWGDLYSFRVSSDNQGNETGSFAYYTDDNRTEKKEIWNRNLSKIKLYYEKVDSKIATGAMLVDYDYAQLNEHYFKYKAQDNFYFGYGNETNASEWNLNHYGQVYQNIAASYLVDGIFELNKEIITSKMPNLFPRDYDDNPSAYPHVQDGRCYQNISVEFLYDSLTKNYVLDSSKYNYKYNESTNSIERRLYDVGTSSQPKQFLPFPSTNDNPDFHFGMMVPINFSIDANREDTKFYFSGDDDIFVYIDGILVLDLGGIHNAIEGEINFYTGKTLINGTDYDNKNRKTSSDLNISEYSVFKNEKLGAPNIYELLDTTREEFAETNHVMNVVYFERGSTASNCKIEVNFDIKKTTTAAFEGIKVDSANNYIEGAQFTLYKQYNSNDNQCSKAIDSCLTDKNGTISFNGLSAGTYYMKETATSSNLFALPEAAVWKLEITENADGTFDKKLSFVNVEAKNLSEIKGESDSVSKIYNKNELDGNAVKTITIKKTWEMDTYSSRPDTLSFNLTGYYLDKNGTKQYINSDNSLSQSSVVYKVLALNKSDYDESLDVWEKTFSEIPIYYDGDDSKIIIWEVDELVPVAYEKFSDEIKTLGNPRQKRIIYNTTAPQAKSEKAPRYTHVDIKSKAANTQSSVQAGNVVAIKDANDIDNQITVIGYYDENEKYHSGATTEAVGQSDYEWSFYNTPDKKRVYLGQNSIVVFKAKMEGANEFYTVVIDKNSVYPAGTRLYASTNGYDRVCQYLGKSTTEEYVDISGCGIFTISLLTCDFMQYKMGYVGVNNIDEHAYEKSDGWYDCGLDLVLSPETILYLNGTGDETYEVSNISAENKYFYEIDKTAESTGRGAKITLSALKGEVINKVVVNENPADVILVVDSSKSMSFPADLEGHTTKLEKLDIEKNYYFVGNSSSATVYRLFYQTEEKTYYKIDENGNSVKDVSKTLKANTWYFVDASVDGITDGSGYSTEIIEFDPTHEKHLGNYKYDVNPQIYKQKGDKTRLDYLMASATSLVDSLPVGSKVSIVTFNEDSKVYNFEDAKYDDGYDSSAEWSDASRTICTVTNENKFNSSNASSYSVLLDGTNTPVTQVRNAILSIKDNLASKTRQDNGLQTAKDVLNSCYYQDGKQVDTNAKFVVFITDGCPNVIGDNSKVKVSDNEYYDAAAAANKCASEIKDFDNLRILSVGLDFNDKMKAAKDLMASCASSKTYYYEATSSDMGIAFTSLISTISTSAAEYKYSKGVITDIIDSRFDLILDDGRRVTNNPTGTWNYSGGETLIGDRWATLSLNENNLIEITWKGRADANGEFSGETLGYGERIPWSVSFNVVAKDDFLGGNMIQTNDPASGVKPNDSDETTPFPKPSVNIDLLKLSIESGEQTVFLGDKLSYYDLDKAISYLMDTVMIQTGDESFVNLMSTVSIDPKSLLSDKKLDPTTNKYTSSVPYSYKGTSDIEGTLVFEMTKDEKPEYVDDKGTTNVTGRPVATYTLTVKYEPNTVEKRQEILTGTGVNAPTEKNEITGAASSGVGTYINNVITTGITVTKYGRQFDRDDNGTPLEGAVYGIYLEDTLLATGVSDNNGNIQFKNKALGTEPTKEFELAFGNQYIVKEISAPTGYAVSGYKYSVEVTTNDHKNYTVTATDISDVKDEKFTTQSVVVSTEAQADTSEIDKAVKLSFDVHDFVLYSLPNTGGSGIYLHIISGILLLMAATLLLYRMKKKNKNV